MGEKKLFCSFDKQEERRAFGGSCFMEIQYCRHERGTPVEQLLSLDYIKNWADDSLYVHGDDQMAFFDQYAGALGWETFMETYGISYFSCEQAAQIMDTAVTARPTDWRTLAGWLAAAKEGNGFYILGI